MNTMDKKRLRGEMLARRGQLQQDEAAVSRASEGVQELIRTLAEWRAAREVLVYWPKGGEVDVRPLVSELWERGCRVLLPRCRPDAPGEMDLACAACESDLTPGPYSLLEPDAHRCPAVASCNPDLALIPGVSFDRRGFRLGFGGGYYDRLLASGTMGRPLLVGIAYAFQLVDELPVQPWDMPVDIVCTEEELWRP
ncbi:5-formyltetrahydrofolate cyclo-ligase [Pseudodesulfovibrio pelocollis]|uniref:5-formyltetrahydrofolate cyclo-ligase n=1 Tax=Pseudodesulfovibrio pelocollis TaxID=3051432 RepID=UPI00255B2647|nr:5-formyltetrahydrofolate cyclo-ligase [Pseudodesulfovibrio sp. SB368]